MANTTAAIQKNCLHVGIQSNNANELVNTRANDLVVAKTQAIVKFQFDIDFLDDDGKALQDASGENLKGISLDVHAHSYQEALEILEAYGQHIAEEFASGTSASRLRDRIVTPTFFVRASTYEASPTINKAKNWYNRKDIAQNKKQPSCINTVSLLTYTPSREQLLLKKTPSKETFEEIKKLANTRFPKPTPTPPPPATSISLTPSAAAPTVIELTQSTT
ncbi:MAG: hypothetical protein FJZ63_04420 [Chlamydiae bacterium]|nr:hypothetical protein [Chlamydiota bacterium]